MIFSQVLFIIYAMFLPVSFILSMIPSFDGMSKRAIIKLFNTILTRAGITLIITTAFSISTMLYTLSAGYPFFLIAFLQIVTFAGIYFKLSDLMSMFSLQSNDSQSVGSRVMRKPRMLMHAHMHRLQRKLGRSMTALGAGSAIASVQENKDSRVVLVGHKQITPVQTDRKNQHLENVSDKQSEQLLIPKIKSLILLVISKNRLRIFRPMQDMQCIKENPKQKKMFVT